jgi:AcrR family transcriptional regulator
MASNDPDASERAAARAPTGHESKGELAAVRARRRHENPDLRDQIMAATLTAGGELGYRKLTVAAVLERYGGYRLQFYTYFGSLQECYVAAHAAHLQRLADRLLAAGARAGSWQAGLRAGLAELGCFAREDPLLARGLLVEVHVAGPPAINYRQEVLERLSSALDSARRETRSRHSPPPLTALFMVNAIESTLLRALAEGEPDRFMEAAPGLEQIITVAYFGGH